QGLFSPACAAPTARVLWVRLPGWCLWWARVLGRPQCTVSYTPGAPGSQAITGAYGGDMKHVESTGTQDVAVDARWARTSIGCSPDPVAWARRRRVCCR